MSSEISGWPQHNGPYDALQCETQRWDAERLDAAKARYDDLDGELGAVVTRLAIGIVDANERPDGFSMLDIYRGQFDDETSGCLLLVNHDEQTLPGRTEEVVEVIKEQRDATGVQAAISVVGYPERRFAQLRQDVWDIGVVHGLRNESEAPIVGVSNDADMVYASPAYWDRMTRNDYVGQQARMWSSRVVPETYGSSDCLVNRLISYLFAARALMTSVTGRTLAYGGSTATTLDTYASTKGWIGSYSDSRHHGVHEPSQLALNIMERASGTPTTEDDERDAILTHVRPVADDGFIAVSARRETLELVTFLNGDPYPMELTSTGNDNQYRRLTPEELAALAESVTNTDRALEHITKLNKAFTKDLDEAMARAFGAALKDARGALDLPDPSEARSY